ncbi:MAG: hypothetical protein HW380_3244 [Magnetococcales bacterium]|nr:hypothetical protein [Magnetococcales bacterium]
MFVFGDGGDHQFKGGYGAVGTERDGGGAKNETCFHGQGTETIGDASQGDLFFQIGHFIDLGIGFDRFGKQQQQPGQGSISDTRDFAHGQEVLQVGGQVGFLDFGGGLLPTMTNMIHGDAKSTDPTHLVFPEPPRTPANLSNLHGGQGVIGLVDMFGILGEKKFFYGQVQAHADGVCGDQKGALSGGKQMGLMPTNFGGQGTVEDRCKSASFTFKDLFEAKNLFAGKCNQGGSGGQLGKIL